MARAPRPGRAKTRLHPLLGPAGAAALQAALIRHTAALACRCAPEVFLAFDPPDAVTQLRPLVPDRVRLFPQHGRDLGERLTAAVDHVTTRTVGPVLVAGTDAPTLGEARLHTAAEQLAAGADVVLGPAHDGGYYLIGLAAPTPAAFAIDPALWGGPRVLAATLAALAGADRKVRLLAPLRDLDTPADAAALLTDATLPADLRALLRPGGEAA
jgi:rSAM/selenodomain-associated transferase 1